MVSIFRALFLCILAVIAVASASGGDSRALFLSRLHDALHDDLDILAAAAENEYVDYVDRFGKLNVYLSEHVDVAAHYMAYQENKAEIERLNAKATHDDEHYSVNTFTDMTAEEKQAMLIPLSSLPSHRRLGWADVADCVTVSASSLPTDAGSRTDTAMAQQGGPCGTVKSQGGLGSCWAFASTGQTQCNYNEEQNAHKVFSEKYATDCTDGSIGTVNGGGLMHKLTEWYENNGACTSFHKEYDDSDGTEYDGDCGCLDSKTYGECYALYADNDGDVIAAAATEHAWDFAVALCGSFYSADTTWYGCRDDEEPPRGGHAMTIVGQKNGDKILVRNSWGSRFGMAEGEFPGHLWFDKSVWSTAAGGTFRSLPLTRTQFDGDNHESEESEDECDCSNGPLPLEWLGWSPSTPLSRCQGDCDGDTDCEGDLRCFADAVPPGCSGSIFHRAADYCYDPSSAANAVVAAPDEMAPPNEYVDTPWSWSLIMTGKELAILVLVAVNLVTIMAVYCLCAQSKRSRKVVVALEADSDSDVDPEEVALRE